MMLSRDLGDAAAGPAAAVLRAGERVLPLPASEGWRGVLGRGAGCELRVAEPTVSRRHLCVERRGGRHYALDLGATWPTLRNEAPLLGWQLLQPGDRLQVGGLLLRYECSEGIAVAPVADAATVSAVAAKSLEFVGTVAAARRHIPWRRLLRCAVMLALPLLAWWCRH